MIRPLAGSVHASEDLIAERDRLRLTSTANVNHFLKHGMFVST